MSNLSVCRARMIEAGPLVPHRRQRQWEINVLCVDHANQRTFNHSDELEIRAEAARALRRSIGAFVQRAAAWITGADRWTEAMWRNLERQVAALEFLEDAQAKSS